MKNNLLKFLIIFSILSNVSFADQFIFETSKIDILDEGNFIIAEKGKAKSIDGDLVINAKKFEYKKNQKTIKAFDGVAFFKSSNLEIKFGELISNQSTLVTTAKKRWYGFDKNISIKMIVKF